MINVGPTDFTLAGCNPIGIYWRKSTSRGIVFKMILSLDKGM